MKYRIMYFAPKNSKIDLQMNSEMFCMFFNIKQVFFKLNRKIISVSFVRSVFQIKSQFPHLKKGITKNLNDTGISKKKNKEK